MMRIWKTFFRKVRTNKLDEAMLAELRVETTFSSCVAILETRNFTAICVTPIRVRINENRTTNQSWL